MHPLIECTVNGESFERLAFFVDVPLELRRPLRPTSPFCFQKLPERRTQRLTLQLVHALILDKLTRAQLGRGFRFSAPPIRHRRYIHVQNVAIQDGRRQVWTGVVRLPVRNRMQRIQRYKAQFVACGPLHQRFQICTIATAPITPRTQAVQTHRQPRGLSTVLQCRWHVSPPWTHHEVNGPRGALCSQFQFVVAQRSHQSQLLSGIVDAAKLRRGLGFKRTHLARKPFQLAGFQVNHCLECEIAIGPHAQWHPYVVFKHDDCRRRQIRPILNQSRFNRRRQVFQRSARHAQGRQNRQDDRVIHHVVFAPNIPIFGVDSPKAGGLPECVTCINGRRESSVHGINEAGFL